MLFRSADVILPMLTLEITAIRDMRLFLDVAEQLGYSERVEIVLNRADSSLGVKIADAEQSIGRRIVHTIVSDGRSVVTALNRGIPFVLSTPEALVSRDIRRMAAALVGMGTETVPDRTGTGRTAQRRSILAWR